MYVLNKTEIQVLEKRLIIVDFSCSFIKYGAARLKMLKYLLLKYFQHLKMYI